MKTAISHVGPGQGAGAWGSREAQSRWRLLHLLVAAMQLMLRLEPLGEDSYPDIMTYWSHFMEPTLFPWGFPMEKEKSQVRASLSCICSSFTNWAHFYQPVSFRGWCPPLESRARDTAFRHHSNAPLCGKCQALPPLQSWEEEAGRRLANRIELSAPCILSTAWVSVPALGEGQHLYVIIFLLLLDIFARPNAQYFTDISSLIPISSLLFTPFIDGKTAS